MSEENIKYAIMNNDDVDGPDPKHGISMVICDDPDEAIYQRVKRLAEEEHEGWDYDRSRQSYVREGEDILDDGWVIKKIHVYYYKIGEERQIHAVFSAWPIIVD